MIDDSKGGRTGLGRRLQAFALAHCTGSYEALVAERKGQLLAPLRGTVVEIGPGTGANLRYYSLEVRWIGVEPNVHAHPLPGPRNP